MIKVTRTQIHCFPMYEHIQIAGGVQILKSSHFFHKAEQHYVTQISTHTRFTFCFLESEGKELCQRFSTFGEN